jgi:hypothetical protein
MPRLLCLPTLPFRWYYFSRMAATGRKIIADRSEVRAFRTMLAWVLGKSGAHLHFAHVDGNELHLALQSSDVSLSGVLGSFCQQYARAINGSRNEKGSVFRPHAHLLLVQREKWFLPLGRYIHWIPQFRSPDSERSLCFWNTDDVYRNRQSIRGLVTSATFRALSRGSRQSRVQDQAYREFFSQKPSRDEVALFKAGSAEDARILGDRAFISDISQQLGLPARRRVIRWSNTEEDIRRATLALIGGLRGICDDSLPANKAREWMRLTTLENVCSKRRAQPLPMIRALGASYVVAHRIATVRQAERFYHCRPRTLSAGRRRRHEEKFRDKFNQSYEQLFEAVGEHNTAQTGGGAERGLECVQLF